MKKHDLLKQLLDMVADETAPIIDAVAERAEVIRSARNRLIYTQGSPADGIYLIAHGAALLEWNRSNGSVVGFRVAVAGDNFGARSFCAAEAHSASARAVRETLALRLPASALSEVLTREPRFWRSLARVVARDAGPWLAKVIRNFRIPVRARLAYLLAYLDHRLDRSVVSPVGHPDSPLRQRDLAHLLDVTDETVSRTIHALRDEDLIRTDPATEAVIIPDHETLRLEYEAYF